MCGIAGFVDFSKSSTEDDLVAMTDSLQHRGPDGSGYQLYRGESAKVGLGHRRLAIIDLSERGAQPMRRGSYSITFNGEIYNYRELSTILAKDSSYQSSHVGHEHHSEALPDEPRINNDTELILAAFERWGPACVDRFQGMFAFVIYDHERQFIHFFRDRAGVKPLFIYQKEDLLLFASELKAFHAHPAFDKSVDHGSVALFFRYGYVPDPKCIFSWVRKLEPGSYLTLKLADRQEKNVKYWDASAIARDTRIIERPSQELHEQAEVLLKTAFDYRTVADVPVGVFLSGGYDSSLVAAMLQKDRTEPLKTFTIGFAEAGYDESPHARAVADQLGTDHTNLICSKTEAQSVIPRLADFYDEPFADSSAIPTFLVSELAAGQVKVALSADGGDELFAGYRRNLRFKRIQSSLNKLPGAFKKPLATVADSIASRSAEDIDRSVWWEKLGGMLRDSSLINLIDRYPHFTSAATLRSLLPEWSGAWQSPVPDQMAGLRGIEDEFNALLAYDYQSTLKNDMLTKVDRATMANSLEGREPMLDHRLYEFVMSVPSTQKMAGGELKSILKKITHRYLPPAIMERPKKGFSIPVGDWLYGDLNYLIRDYLNEAEFARFGILHPRKTVRVVDRLLANRDNNNQLWFLLVFQLWCRRWL